ncbi:STAS domain-containing protein [Nannocystis pusilla]|uniref:STAS domain-containing protein n=1 Tax=Nannocystis pusilla TaxID=889268 RepID=UPI003DA67413
MQARRAAFVLLDVTGVPRVDEVAARALADVTRAVRLLGAELVLTGIKPEVARVLVELGPNSAERRRCRASSTGSRTRCGRRPGASESGVNSSDRRFVARRGSNRRSAVIRG